MRIVLRWVKLLHGLALVVRSCLGGYLIFNVIGLLAGEAGTLVVVRLSIPLLLLLLCSRVTNILFQNSGFIILLKKLIKESIIFFILSLLYFICLF